MATAGCPAGTTIIALGTGTGGLGTYTLSDNANATAANVDATTLGTSVDFPAEVRYALSPFNFAGQGNHQNNHPVAHGPRNVGTAPLLFLDGVEIDVTVKGRYYATEWRFLQNSKVLRSRNPPLASTGAGFAVEFEDIRLNARDQLRHRCLTVFLEQFTGAGYYPLLTLAQTWTRYRRDYVNGLGGPQWFTLPGGYTPGTDDPVSGVTDVIYSSGTALCEIHFDDTKIWAAGKRPRRAFLLAPTAEYHNVKLEADQHKQYCSVEGPTAVVLPNGSTSGRFEVGDVLEREYTLKLTA